MTDTYTVKYPDVAVQLTGRDGNVFAIIGAVRKALWRAEVPNAEIERFTDECTSGDYDHALQTCMKWVAVS